MHEVLSQIVRWWEAGERFGLATVVGTFRSAPRPPGASMAVFGEEVAGSVSGGCVEGAVYDLAQRVVAGGGPVLQRYGVSDDDAFSVGLTCGGVIDVFVEPVSREEYPELGEVAASIERREPVAVATIISGSGSIGSGSIGSGSIGSGSIGSGSIGSRRVVRAGPASGTLGSSRLDDAVDDDARGMLAQGVTGVRRYGAEGERRLEDLQIFVQSFAPAPRMLVFGAIDFAVAVSRIGKFLGYHVVVCDARPVFATRRRFPEADEVVVRWPHDYLSTTVVDERTAICVLTHDPRFDVPLLEVALRTPAAYVGAMGSRHTHEDRLRRLREAGVTEAELARLRSPIGLDLGARTPEETALSIAAELVQLRWGGSGRPLTETTGRIHGEEPDGRA
ncbi:XdhC/CoxI family protein [Streptosporangium sp. NPDC051022]|uniref:XdhC/CoxI family protein n=1 Tax=Streptosporangium sp. NPDC051022 TaxID=3155752 RepID=UPI00341E7A29